MDEPRHRKLDARDGARQGGVGDGGRRDARQVVELGARDLTDDLELHLRHVGDLVGGVQVVEAVL